MILQKKISLTEEQQEKVRELYGTIINREIAKQIGVNYCVLMNNLRIMNVPRKQPKVKPPQSFCEKMFTWKWAADVDPVMTIN